MGSVVTGVVAVPREAIKPVASTAVRKRDLAQTLKERAEETITKTTEAIKGGKLSDKDLAASYCLRSSAYGDVGKHTEALADANAALKLMPNSVDVLTSRAYAYFIVGDFDRSVADYSKAITLGATAKALHQRGISRFYAGRLEEAAEDFAKASGDGDDREQQVFTDLWLSWTYLRLGKPLPPDVVGRAAAEPRGDWPRPALAMFAGQLTPQEMIKSIDRKTGDDRTLALVEGHFYLAQYHLARGELPKAREYFEKTRAPQVVSFNEHIAAGFELRRLATAEKTAHPAAVTTGAIPAPPEGTAPNPATAAEGRTVSAPAPAKKAKPKTDKTDAWNFNIWK